MESAFFKNAISTPTDFDSVDSHLILCDEGADTVAPCTGASTFPNG